MSLEQVFECPLTLAKLHSAPLGELLESFCKSLLDHGFSRRTIRLHLSHLALLNEHLHRPKGRMRQTVKAGEIEGFFDQHPSPSRNRGPLEGYLARLRQSVNRFTAYLRQRGRLVSVVSRPTYQPLAEAYAQWMRCYRQAVPATLRERVYFLIPFLRWLGPDATPRGLASLDCEKVEQFFLAYASENRRSGRKAMQSTLRTFFRFALHAGYLRQPLDRAVPTLRTYKLATVPVGLTEDQARSVLQKIERNTNVGRRDYAIVQLLFTYGVRGGQLRTLRLEEIDWAQEQILFKAAKHGKDVRLPLTWEVGEGLLDYLRNGRPNCSCGEVFLTARAPYHPFPHASTLTAIIQRRLDAAGIDLCHAGAHAFRHGFATRMLQQGHPLKAIADVLGHRHLSTTFLYTKVDFNSLREVALEWPQEVSP